MNIRWLFGNYTDPQYKLSRRQQKELSDLAHEKYMPRRTFFWWTFLVQVIPVLLVIRFALPAVLDWLGMGGQTLPYGAGLALIMLAFWFWSAWAYRSIYIKPVRQAMRDRGYDICITCGYDLRGLGDDIDRCPECGTVRSAQGGDGARSENEHERMNPDDH